MAELKIDENGQENLSIYQNSETDHKKFLVCRTATIILFCLGCIRYYKLTVGHSTVKNRNKYELFRKSMVDCSHL